MHTAFISIGSNIGNRLDNCKKAIKDLADGEEVKLIKTSSFYETEPWGEIEQGWFINCVIEIETVLDAYRLFSVIRKVEEGFKRKRVKKGGPRIIDLDVLFFDREIINTEGLTIPHPLLHKRRFVLMPLNEIAPDLVHPVFKKSVADLLKALDDNKKVKIFPQHGGASWQ